MNNRGIALLIAVLISSIGLAIGVGIFDVFFRELRISRTIFPSFVAFFAADAGGECTLYWHLRLAGSLFDPASPPATINCGGDPPSPPIPVTHTTLGNGDEQFSFQYELDNDSCVRIIVRRRDVETIDECTRIDSFGRNEGCAGGGAGFVVERGLVIRDPEDPDLCPI